MHLDCRHIRYKYPHADSYLFEDLDLRLPGPGFHAFFGPSGVGKTTAARIICGDIQKFEGTIETGYEGKRLYSYNLERLPDWSAVGQHLRRISEPAMNPRREALLSAFELSGCVTSRFSQLSLGQKNRINLIRYLLQDFDLLIMDESLANVDEPTREHIIQTIKQLYPQRCFIYISHNVIEVSKFCDQIVVFRGKGKIPATVTVSGQNALAQGPANKKALQSTMLEIMHAG